MNRVEGYIDLEELLQEIGVNTANINTILNNSKINVIKHIDYYVEVIIFSFDYHGETFFYKYNNCAIPYSELVAEELAKDFGIPCVSYDLAIIKNNKGVISKNYKDKDKNYIRGIDLLKECFPNNYPDDIEKNNNLYDIWNALEYRYLNYSGNEEIVSKLMKQIVDISIFDILTCQDDRHSMNWEIVESKDIIEVVPIYDNERIGKHAFVSLNLDNRQRTNLNENLKNFLSVSSFEYEKLIKEKLWIISNENIDKILKRVEDKIDYLIPDKIKHYYLDTFKKHNNAINEVLEYHDKERKR